MKYLITAFLMLTCLGSNARAECTYQVVCNNLGMNCFTRTVCTTIDNSTYTRDQLPALPELPKQAPIGGYINTPINHGNLSYE